MGYFKARTADRLRNIYSVIIEYTGTKESLVSLPLSTSKLIWQYDHSRGSSFLTGMFNRRKRPVFLIDIVDTDQISERMLEDKRTALYELNDLLTDGIYIEFKDPKEQTLFMLEAPHVLNKWAALQRV
ncbi:hypothetical protein L2D08_17070 [Domibacillus sp. PGB-M46]|uniref:hypothetical protein n=1 Tax=Domibacillus sp. PGB-M46 TaxID=2910255 RepID=UPI001F56D81E|nr:hypothetical protein [Domibacillus sp. PGB-M46]MCI2256067.1 hypothetical protein [Domibacillus sp. PGB-M46]